MEEYIKLFQNHTQYEAYKNSADYIRPNVSYCEDNDDVHYNYYPPIVAVFNVTDTSSPTQLLSSPQNIIEMEIDGVVQPEVVNRYQFDTTGEHTVKYVLDDKTTISSGAFNSCQALISVVIPDTVTSIGNSAFYYCRNLASVNIPDSVTSIGSSAFYRCSNLETITCLATTAPTIQSTTFGYVKTDGTLYVPTGSNYSTWMGTGNYYLGLYNWTKVEQ